MKDLTHKQAIKYIHLRLDGMLNENQQFLLDEHLRVCEACRACSHEMESLPAELSHEFQSRWNKNPGPSQIVLRNVTANARSISMTNRFSSNFRLLTGAVALILLAFAINLVVSQLQSISPLATKATNSSSKNEGGLIVFTSAQSGNLDIYTIHADGSGLSNITNNRARDVNPYWSPDGRRIAFESDRNGFEQIYLMDANGSNPVPLTNDETDQSLPLNDDGRSNPWSPDGSKLLYLEQKPEDKTTWLLYSIDINSKAKILLARGRIQSSNLSWSPDGNFVGYVLNDSTTPDDTFAPGINIVKADGTQNFAIKELLPPKEGFSYPSYYWSQDGHSIFFTAYKHINEGQDQWIAYEASIPKHALIEKVRSSTQMQDWWDGTSFIVGNGTGSPLTWLRSDKTYSTLKPLDNCEIADPTAELQYGVFPRRSFSGDQVIAFTCPNNNLLFYYTNSDGTIIKQLFKFPVPSGKQGGIANIIWSPDNRFIAFKITSSEKNTLYILNVSEALNNPSIQPLQILLDESSMLYEPSWQSIVNNKVVKNQATPQPTHTALPKGLPDVSTGISNGKWIAFIGGKTVPVPNSTALTMDQDVYLIHPDGSGLSNITNFPAQYYDLQWSPDGQHLLFLRKRDDNKVDVMRHYVGFATGAETITRPIITDNYGYSWSPNSDKIAFADASNGNYDIYTEYANGSNDPQLTQLTTAPAQDIGPAWSPNGNQIAFQRLDGEKLLVMVMNVDGSNQHEVAHGTGEVRLHWSQDGNSIYVSGIENNWLDCKGCVHNPAIYRIDLTTRSVQQIYYEQDAGIKIVGWYLYDAPEGTLYFMRIDHPSFLGIWGTWMRADRNSVSKIGDFDPHQTCKTTTGSILNERILPNERFSIISVFCAGGFHLYLADREATDPQQMIIPLIQLPSGTQGAGGDEATLPMTSSPDGRWLIYDNGQATMYLLNVEKAMQGSTTEPSVLIQPQLYITSSGTFQSSDTISIFDLAWQPIP